MFVQLRHQDGDTEALLLDEMLDETNQLDITASIRHWLATEVCVYVCVCVCACVYVCGVYVCLCVVCVCECE